MSVFTATLSVLIMKVIIFHLLDYTNDKKNYHLHSAFSFQNLVIGIILIKKIS